MIRQILLVIFSCAIALGAQSWEDLSGLKPGDRVKVKDASGKEYKGSFRALSADAITIETRNKELSVERARVRRVQIASSSRRLRHFAIGAGIGFALGLITDQTLGAFLRNESGEGTGARALTYIAPIGLFGGIAAAAPAYKTVYRTR